MPSLYVAAELASSLRQALEPQRTPDMLVSFGRWALVQRESIMVVRAASPMAVATVALATGFALGALFASLLAFSKLGRRRREAEAETKMSSKERPATAGGTATAKVSLISSSSSAAAAAAAAPEKQQKPDAYSDAAMLDARLLREAVKSRELAEAEAELAKREAAALREEVAALASKLAASQRTRRAVAAELAAAFGLPPTPTPASAPPASRSGLGGGATPASRFFASPPPAAGPSSEGRASRVAKALAAA